MSDIKDNLEGCEICLRHVDVDTLVSMLDRKKFNLSLIHISEPTRLGMISYAVFCLKKKNDDFCLKKKRRDEPVKERGQHLSTTHNDHQNYINYFQVYKPIY